jgi:hypothetical protein
MTLRKQKQLVELQKRKRKIYIDTVKEVKEILKHKKQTNGRTKDLLRNG